MKKIALILCLVLVASFVLSGCNNSDSIITLEDREVGKIEIQSGNTGETVEVTEEEESPLSIVIRSKITLVACALVIISTNSSKRYILIHSSD